MKPGNREVTMTELRDEIENRDTSSTKVYSMILDGIPVPPPAAWEQEFDKRFHMPSFASGIWAIYENGTGVASIAEVKQFIRGIIAAGCADSAR